jgi:hypothetical protein
LHRAGFLTEEEEQAIQEGLTIVNILLHTFPLFVSVSVHLMVHMCMNEMHFDDFLACKFNVSVIFYCTFLTILFYVFIYWTLIFTLPAVNLLIMI